MPIKGTDIVKKLPEGGKKACKECGFPTCFAFAMKLASGGVTIDKCTYLAPEIRKELEEALAPPIHPVVIGCGENALIIGNEEVIYRHEKTFVHKPGIALLISDRESPIQVDEKIKSLNESRFSWVGLTLKPDLLALKYESGDKAGYLALVKKASESTEAGLVLISEDMEALFAARDLCASRCPLLYPITAENIDKAIPKIKERPTPVAVRAKGVAELVPLTIKLKENGIEDVVMDPGSRSLTQAIADQTLIRRACLKQNFRPLGYPTIGFPAFMTNDAIKETMLASMFVMKYAGVIVLSQADKRSLLPLLVHRLNIYTDPRIPMSVEDKIYPILEPSPESPVLLTGNWALTYFIVASEIESSKVPAWLLVKNTEGLGVLTAWAAGKFSGDNIGPYIKKSSIETKVKHRKLVLPGKVARIKGELEEALPDWEIIVGPREAAEIPNFLPNLVKSWKS